MVKILLSPFLALSALLYRFGYICDKTIRRSLSVSLPVPVISIGNLTLGGTGKTPLLIRLVKDMETLNLNPAILTRGYAGMFKSSGSQVLTGEPSHNGAFLSDEVRLLANALPKTVIGVGKNRIESAEMVSAQGKTDFFVLDDGFQHWPLKRDWDVLCIDATNPWGGNHLVPWGRLREPREEIKRADLVVLTRCELLSSEEVQDLKSEISTIHPQAMLLSSTFIFKLLKPHDESEVGFDSIQGKTILALSSIGNPTAFEKNLSQIALAVVSMRYPDHHNFTTEDVASIVSEAQHKKIPMVMTEKDWVKLREFKTQLKDHSDIFIVKADLEFDGPSQTQWSQWLSDMKGKYS